MFVLRSSFIKSNIIQILLLETKLHSSRLAWRLTKILVHASITLPCVLLIISRVLDYKHHLSDLVFSIIIGVVLGLYLHFVLVRGSEKGLEKGKSERPEDQDVLSPNFICIAPSRGLKVKV